MGLSRSLYTGWTGMATHQRCLDNTGNNLANVNTVGYRKADFMFTNLLNQVMTGAMAADGARGSVNPKTIGAGVTTGAIVHNFTQGPTEGTGNPLDVAINGNGFFMAQTSSGIALTRNGSFYLDHTRNPSERMLCVGDGLPVQGWMAVDGTISPSTTVSNIYLPAYGDLLPGKSTSEVDLKGILPTNTDSSDFNGRETTSLDLKGNLPGGGSSVTTRIYAPVTQSDGITTGVKDEVQEIQVRVDFTGPTLSPDGTVNSWGWTMTTVDWPNPGDPGVQIYPPADNQDFDHAAVKFYAEGSAAEKRAPGQVVDSFIKPGSSQVSTSYVDANGQTVTTRFAVPTDFTLDVSRLTSLEDAPGGNALETWHVNGNPKDTMARTITVFDEYTDFIESTDGSGNAIMEAVRRVEARENTIYFRQTELDNAGSTWSWKSSLDDASGELRFNTIGDLVESNQSGGGISYDFGELRSINYDGSLQATAQDGYRDGNLKEISIDQNGKIFGHYTNDVVEPLAQLAMGLVANPSGLEGVSGTLFYPGTSSGSLMVGIAGDAEGAVAGLAAIGAGLLSSGRLEMSNVDLSREFTGLITTERGYQLNSKVISTSDEMLQTALQIKR